MTILVIHVALVDLLAVRQKAVHLHHADLFLAGLLGATKGRLPLPGWSSSPSSEDVDSLGEPLGTSLEEASGTVKT